MVLKMPPKSPQNPQKVPKKSPKRPRSGEEVLEKL